MGLRPAFGRGNERQAGGLTIDTQTLNIVPAALMVEETAQLAGKRGLLASAWDVLGLVLSPAS